MNKQIHKLLAPTTRGINNNRISVVTTLVLSQLLTNIYIMGHIFQK